MNCNRKSSMWKVIGAIHVFIIFSLSANAQDDYIIPKIGDNVIEHEFYDVINYPTKTVKINDFRGKWLILDFWGYSCSACIASFPKMNTLAAKLRDKVQVIMIGATKSEINSNQKRIAEVTKTLYSKLAKRYGLNFTVAFDSTLYLRYDVGALPHQIVIDPNGIIRYKTVSISEDEIQSIVDGELVKLDYSYSRHEKRPGESYDESKMFLTNGTMANGGYDTSFIFRSILTPKSDFTPFGSVVDLYKSNNIPVKTGTLNAFQHGITALYYLAFFGVSAWEDSDTARYKYISRKIIMSESDSIRFAKIVDKRYNYSLTIPPQLSSVETIKRIMRSDLANYFDFSITRKRLPMPVYYVRIDSIKAAKYLRPKEPGEFKNLNSDKNLYKGLKYKNIKLDEFIELVTSGLYLDEPIIIENVSSRKIDVNLVADMTNPKEVIAALNSLGIELVSSERYMDVLVVNNFR